MGFSDLCIRVVRWTLMALIPAETDFRKSYIAVRKIISMSAQGPVEFSLDFLS